MNFLLMIYNLVLSLGVLPICVLLYLKQSLAYYVGHGTVMYCGFLDATKTFDRVNYCKHFRLLMKRHLPVYIIRVLLTFYIFNFVRVSLCGFFSDYFVAANGVKQGGVLLFCVYLDGLLLAMSNSHVGCFTGDVFTGALAYADDIVLSAPSASALRNMLAVCDKYAVDFDMLFNADKSKCMIVLPPSRRYLEPLLSSIDFMIGERWKLCRHTHILAI